MAKQNINIGSYPSDGTGDPIRVSFNKINQNFTELYDSLNSITNNIQESNSALSTVSLAAGGIPGTGEAATVSVQPVNNTSLIPGVYHDIPVSIGNGLVITVSVTIFSDISAVVISSSDGFSIGNSGVLDGSFIGGTSGVDDLLITVETLTNVQVAVPLDLTKIVQKLSGGYFTLANGVEGQIMYIVRQTGTNYVRITAANARFAGIVYQDIFMEPFANNNNMVQLMFTDGAWQSIGGLWD